MRTLILALALGACSTPPPPPGGDGPPPASTAPADEPAVEDEPGVEGGPFADLDDYRARRAAALADLEAAVGTPTASGPRSCLVLPVGAKPCGGPTSFVAYSTETAEVPVLLGLAKRVADLDRAATEQFERMSDCMVREAPPAVLEDGACVLGD